MLKNEFSFERACIPMNPRNSKASSSDFDTSGTPICPVTGKPFTFLGKSGGKNRSSRFKWVCPASRSQGLFQSVHLRTSLHRFLLRQVCLHLSRQELSPLSRHPQKHRPLEQPLPIQGHPLREPLTSSRDSFTLDSGKSHRTATVKADLFLAGIHSNSLASFSLMLCTCLSSLSLFAG